MVIKKQQTEEEAVYRYHYGKFVKVGTLKTEQIEPKKKPTRT